MAQPRFRVVVRRPGRLAARQRRDDRWAGALRLSDYRRGVSDVRHRQRLDAAHTRLPALLATGGRDHPPPPPQHKSYLRPPPALPPGLARFGLLALFPFITAVWQIYALIFAINAVTAFFTPTFEAGIPEVTGAEQYVQALSYSRVAVDVEAVAGPAVAGLLVALLGLRW